MMSTTNPPRKKNNAPLSCRDEEAWKSIGEDEGGCSAITDHKNSSLLIYTCLKLMKVREMK